MKPTRPPFRTLLLRPSLRNRPPGHHHHTRPNSTNTSTTTPTATRIDKLLSRLPRWSHKYTSRLRAAPLSHVTAFLVLHELTAVVPLLGLSAAFHYCVDVRPLLRWVGGHDGFAAGAYVAEGARRFEKYFTRKGWFGFGREAEDGEMEGAVREGREEETAVEKWQEDGDVRYRVVVEVALAYAITKAFLPVRIIGSVWATPWFAGVLGRLRRFIRPSR